MAVCQENFRFQMAVCSTPYKRVILIVSAARNLEFEISAQVLGSPGSDGPIRCGPSGETMGIHDGPRIRVEQTGHRPMPSIALSFSLRKDRDGQC